MTTASETGAVLTGDPREIQVTVGAHRSVRRVAAALQRRAQARRDRLGRPGHPARLLRSLYFRKPSTACWVTPI